MKLPPGSPAIGAGNTSVCATAPENNKDQRGFFRLTDGKGNKVFACDIGAYEAPSVPTLSQAFVPARIAKNAISTVTFSVSNVNSVAGLSNISFTDSLPSGVVVAATPGVTDNCNIAGTVTANPGSTQIIVNGVGIPGAFSCTITVKITSAGVATYT